MRVQLVDHDRAWADEFESLRARLAKALAPPASGIHHVGSTAIPGILAKPIIDVLLVVPDSADESSYVPLAERAGLILHRREPHWHEHRLLKYEAPAANVHVFSEGCAEIARMIAFRDLLRTDEHSRLVYQSRKVELAQREWGRVQDYADAKGETVEQLLRTVADRWPEVCVHDTK